MKTLKVDKSLAEVWDWKKKADEEYNSLAGLSPAERYEKISEKNNEMLNKNNIKLKTVKK